MSWLFGLLFPLLKAGLTDKLMFSAEPGDVTAMAGEVLVLPCGVTGRGRGDQGVCTWNRDGVDVEVVGNRVRLEGCGLVLEP